MKNLRKKTGCLVMTVLLLIMTFVPAVSVPVSAAANIEGRLITVGGKTVSSGMKIAEVEKLFGKPKLTTPSYWGGYAYTFYGDKYSDYLYLETDADGVIVCYGSVSPGFETNVYNYGDKVDRYVRLGYEATDYDDNLYGVIYYTNYHSDAYERFGANLTENNRNLNKHAAEMWNAVSYLHGYDTPTCFDEQLFNVGAQLADNYSTVYDYCNDTGQSACYQLMGSNLISFPEYRYPNPLEFAEKGKNYTCKNGNAIGLMYYPKGSDKSQYWVINGFVNKELLAEWNPVAYTTQEKQQLKQARDYYAKSVEEFNAEKSYYEVEPSYDSLDTIEGGKLSEGIAKGAVDFLNAIRAGGGLNPLEYSEQLSADAQCKSTYTVYLSKNKISNPDPHFPPQLDGLSDEYYAKCQSGSGENLFMCGIISTNIIGSISNALDDSYGTGQYYTRGHRYNLLDPSWKYIGVGNTVQQGCHKMTGTQDYDAEVVAWPAKGVTISESGFAPSGMWTCQFYNGLKPTSDTTVTVRCLNSGAVWKIDPANLLDSQAYQANGTLISYADNSIAFKVGGVYEITYEHLNDRDGKDASYTYRTVYEKAYLSSDGKKEPQRILFDKDSMELTPGSTEKLTAIIHPEDASNKRIYFTSTNPAVATVNECGEITAHTIGTAVITAVSEAGNITANCKVTVVQKKAETATGRDDEKTPDRKPDTQSSIKVGKAKIKSAKKKKTSPTVTITLARKVSKASGYQIKVYPTSGKAKKNKGAITTKFITKNTKKLVVKNKKLKNKKRCYVRIRAYQKINGTKKFGAWSAVKKVNFRMK